MSVFFFFFFLRTQFERDAIDSPATSYSPFLYVYALTRTSPPPRRHAETCVVRTLLLLLLFLLLSLLSLLLLFLLLRATPRPPSRILIELSPLLMRLRSVSVEPRFRVTDFRVGVRPCVYRTRGCVRDAPYLFTHVVEYNCAHDTRRRGKLPPSRRGTRTCLRRGPTVRALHDRSVMRPTTLIR